MSYEIDAAESVGQVPIPEERQPADRCNESGPCSRYPKCNCPHNPDALRQPAGEIVKLVMTYGLESFAADDLTDDRVVQSFDALMAAIAQQAAELREARELLESVRYKVEYNTGVTISRFLSRKGAT